MCIYGGKRPGCACLAGTTSLCCSCFFTAHASRGGQRVAAVCICVCVCFGLGLFLFFFLVSVYESLGFPRGLIHPWLRARRPRSSDQLHPLRAHTKPASLAMP